MPRSSITAPSAWSSPWPRASSSLPETVRRARYQPEGVRSFGGQRYGLRSAPANPAEIRPHVYPMIEDRRALADISAIAAVKGISGLHIGPVDLGLRARTCARRPEIPRRADEHPRRWPCRQYSGDDAHAVRRASFPVGRDGVRRSGADGGHRARAEPVSDGVESARQQGRKRVRWPAGALQRPRGKFIACGLELAGAKGASIDRAAA